MRIITCAFCGKSKRYLSRNEVFSGDFDAMLQSSLWPSVFLHRHCAKDIISGFEDLFDSIHAPDNILTRELSPVWDGRL